MHLHKMYLPFLRYQAIDDVLDSRKDHPKIKAESNQKCIPFRDTVAVFIIFEDLDMSRAEEMDSFTTCLPLYCLISLQPGIHHAMV